jgi:prolyl-tRNA editing enzyme YbaK/EbsC (Cys-tRNA(Pro) deacylase)
VRSFADVHDALRARGVEHEIIQLSSSSRTAELAAEALGVPVSWVVKSMVFMADGQPVLALVDGEATVDVEVLSRELVARDVTLARGREVRDLTGFRPGAVPPVGLATDIPVLADPAVFAPEVVYCGGGTTTAMLRIRAADLEGLLAARVARIARRG